MATVKTNTPDPNPHTINPNEVCHTIFINVRQRYSAEKSVKYPKNVIAPNEGGAVALAMGYYLKTKKI